MCPRCIFHKGVIKCMYSVCFINNNDGVGAGLNLYPYYIERDERRCGCGLFDRASRKETRQEAKKVFVGTRFAASPITRLGVSMS